MSCSGPRRMDAPDEWFGSAGPPPARLAGNADHFHHRARRSVNAPDRTRRGSFCAPYKTVRERGSGKGYSEGSRRLGRDKYARARGFSDNFGQPNCVILRENSKATILPKQRILRDAQNVRFFTSRCTRIRRISPRFISRKAGRGSTLCPADTSLFRGRITPEQTVQSRLL